MKSLSVILVTWLIAISAAGQQQVEKATLTENLLLYDDAPSQVGGVFSTDPKQLNEQLVATRGMKVKVVNKRVVKTLGKETVWYEVVVPREQIQGMANASIQTRQKQTYWIYGGSQEQLNVHEESN